MSQRVLLNLGQGNWLQGFPGVTAQLWEGTHSTPIQFSGSLPPQPELGQQYNRWRSLYSLLYGDRQTRRVRRDGNGTPRFAPGSLECEIENFEIENFEIENFDIEIDDDDITNVSSTEFHQLGDQLRLQLNQWLEASTFRPIDRKLRTYLAPSDEIRLVISAQDQDVLRFPWRLWCFFEDYPRSELALSPLTYHRSVKHLPQKAIAQVNVLAILGNADGIDVVTDQAFLSALPDAAVTVLAEPTLEAVTQVLWNQSWDILFFAGHSSSQEQNHQQTGYLQLNGTDRMSLDQLKYGLRAAIAKGLQLAIFNSCDGLGLAWNLADLNIPQVIVMREPVPDQVAHTFLKQFLQDFSLHHPLYLAVRNAREKLQPLEADYPCATWLPIIVQNPAELPSTWQMLLGQDRPTSLPSTPTVPLPSTPASPHPLTPTVPPTPSSPPVPVASPSSTSASAPLASPVPSPIPLSRPGGLKIPLILILIPGLITALTLALRFIGIIESMELQALDRLMHLRPHELPDQRLLVVTIGETDIQNQGSRGSSLSEAALEQALIQLRQHNARVVGLDVYRDYPAHEDYPQLAALLRQEERRQHALNPGGQALLPPAVVGVCKGRDPIADPLGVAPAPELMEDLVGFSDFVEDSDGIVRRQLMLMKPDPVAVCTTPYAFSSRLAFLYLQGENMTPLFNGDGHLVLGDTVLSPLSPRNGGYQPIDARGDQILLNYRALPSPQQIAHHVSLTQLLQGQVNPGAIANRIVIIGVTANSASDHWSTPYGTSGGNKTAGVFIQAQMTSQLLSAVLDQRPLLRSLSPEMDMLWMGGWAMLGSAIAFLGHKTQHQTDRDRSGHVLWSIGSSLLGVGGLGGSCLWLLIQGYWFPLIPATMTFLGSGAAVNFMLKRCRDEMGLMRWLEPSYSRRHLS